MHSFAVFSQGVRKPVQRQRPSASGQGAGELRPDPGLLRRGCLSEPLEFKG